MLVLVHVLIALSSVIYSASLFLKPTKRKFYITYLLVGATLGTGTYLVLSTHSSLTHSCVTGLIYLAIVFAAIVPAHYRLIASKAKNKLDRSN